MRRRLVLVLGALSYAWLLSWVYVERISPIFAYEGSRYTPPPDGVAPIGFMLALLPALWMPVALERPSQVVYWFLYAIVYVPTCLLAMFGVSIEAPLLVAFLVCLAVCFTALGLIYRLPLFRLPDVQISPPIFWIGVCLFSLACYGLILSTSGLRVALVGLEDVYSLRADYTSIIARSGPALVYAVSWQVGIVNPLLIAYGLFHRNPAAVIFGVLLELGVYSITGFKTALFSGLVLVLIAMALRRNGRHFGWMLLAGLIAMVLAAVNIDEWTHGALWSGILINRTLAMPGLLTGYYFEFFSQNPQALLGNSVLRPLFAYPYALDIPPLVGAVYLNGAWANANVWADAYANFGYVGLFAFTLVLAVVLHVFDSVAAGHDVRFPALLGASIGWTLANGALLTSLLTNGIGWLILALYVMPRSQRLRGGVASETPRVGRASRFRWLWSDWEPKAIQSLR